MPSVTPKQQRFFGAELGRKRAGKPTQTGLPAPKLAEFAMKVRRPAKPKKGKPILGKL